MLQSARTQMLYGSFIILECLLWGFGNTIIKIALETISPFYCLAIRYMLALLIYGIFYGKKIKAHKNELWRCIPISLVTAFAFIMSNLALKLTSATIAGLLMGISVLFTPFLAYFMQKSPISKRVMLSVLLVIGGMYFLTGGEGAGGFGLGEVCALLASLSFALSLILSADYLRHSDPAILSTMQAGVAALVTLLLALIFEDYHMLRETSLTGWAAIVYLALCCTCAAYLLQNAALKHVSPVFASIAFCTEPIFTALSAYLLLAEKLPLAGYAGAVLIIAGIVIASVSKTPEDMEQPAREQA